MASLSWTARSLADLERIGDQIDQFDSAAATRVVGEIRCSVERLKMWSLSAPAIAGTPLRKVSVPRYPYVVVYRVDRQIVRILRVRHTAENWRSE